MKTWIALVTALTLLAGSAIGAQKTAAPKLTCCQQAAVEGKDCRHKCCVAAHQASKSCTKCNPNKEDLSLKKAAPKAAAKARS